MVDYHVLRTDRELTDPAALESILVRGRFATLGFCQDGGPYVVTLSYGYDSERRALYFHAAKAGRKVDAIAADPRACATIVIDGGYEQGACKHNYESVVMTGLMTLVADLDEKRHGMHVLTAHLETDPTAVREHNRLDGDEVYKRLNILRFDIRTLTGKAGS
jgi:nitroimidazol reductase NimA-like FMN-containing flavoprotein (pyridoxamine 5'-phosphate oxidase superfamily)